MRHQFGAATLMKVSVIEIVGCVGALQASPATMAEISLALIRSVQRLYFFVTAPALWLPLGLVIRGSDMLPRIWDTWRSSRRQVRAGQGLRPA